MEPKTTKQAPAKQRLNEQQLEWHRQWRGRPVTVITSASQAFDFARHLAGSSR